MLLVLFTERHCPDHLLLLLLLLLVVGVELPHLRSWKAPRDDSSDVGPMVLFPWAVGNHLLDDVRHWIEGVAGSTHATTFVDGSVGLK